MSTVQPKKCLSGCKDRTRSEHDESMDLDSAFMILDLLKPEESLPTKKDTPSKSPRQIDASMPALITTAECAAIIDDTPTWVAKMCRDGILPAVKVGRTWMINSARFLEMIGVN